MLTLSRRPSQCATSRSCRPTRPAASLALPAQTTSWCGTPSSLAQVRPSHGPVPLPVEREGES